MKKVGIIEGIKYPTITADETSCHHSVAVEIVSRLQELDELSGGDESSPPAGIALIRKLAAIERRSRRAYRLLLDMLTRQDSLSCSFDEIAARHTNARGVPTSRQSVFQNMQADIDVIQQVMPEIGKAMSDISKRRIQSQQDS